MLQGSSALKTPANGVKDNSEVLLFEYQNMKRKKEVGLEERFPPILRVMMMCKPDVKDTVDFYKKMCFHEMLINEDECQELFDPPFTDTAQTKKLWKKLSTLNLTPLISFAAEIKDFEKLINVVLKEVKSNEEDIATIREMNQFLIKKNGEQQSFLKERSKVLETNINRIYNTCFTKLKEVSTEWDEVKKLKDGDVKELRFQILTEKQKAFERLFIRSVSFRSQLQDMLMEIEDDTKPMKITIAPVLRERAQGIMTPFRSIISELTRFTITTSEAKLDGDDRLALIAGNRLMEDLAVLCSRLLDYHCELRDLFKRICDTELSKKQEFRKLSMLLSIGLDKDGILIKCSENLLALELVYMNHNAELDESLASSFDEVLEIKPKPGFVI